MKNIQPLPRISVVKALHTISLILLTYWSGVAEAAETRLGSQGDKHFIHLENYDENTGKTISDIFLRKSAIIAIEVIAEYNDPELQKTKGSKFFLKIITNRIHAKPIRYGDAMVGGSSSQAHYILQPSRKAAILEAKSLMSSAD